MKQTENILRIKNIEREKVASSMMVKIQFKMIAVVEFHCNICETIPFEINIISESRPVSSSGEGLRQVIENFLNGNSRFDTQIHNVESESDMHFGINRLIIDFGDDEFKREFEQIFRASNWQNIKLQIN